MVLGHVARGEALLEPRPHRRPVEAVKVPNRLHRVFERVDEGTGHAVLEHLGHRARRHGDDRGAACHRLDHDQPERLRPVDREKERGRVPEELGLVLIADLADELDERMVEQRLDLGMEELLVDRVHLGGEAQRHAHRLRDLDGTIDALLRRDAAQEGEVAAGAAPRRVKVGRQAMVDRGDPVRVRNRPALVVADADERRVAEHVEQRLELRQVEATMHGRDLRHREVPRSGKVQVAGMPVDDVELVRHGADELGLEDLGRERIGDRVPEPQGLRPGGEEARARLRVPACNERHVVALPHELLGQPGNDALGPTVLVRRHALEKRRHFGNAHRSPIVSWRHRGRAPRCGRVSVPRDPICIGRAGFDPPPHSEPPGQPCSLLRLQHRLRDDRPGGAADPDADFIVRALDEALGRQVVHVSPALDPELVAAVGAARGGGDHLGSLRRDV